VSLGATVVLVAHGEEDRALTRLLRDVLPSLRVRRRVVEFELVVVDNSGARLERLAEAVLRNGDLHARYLWNHGENAWYGPALNQAVAAARHPFIVYACARHGRMHDPTWIDDLLRPLAQDASGRVAMTGSLYPSGAPSHMGFPDTLEWTHVQGGVFAARREVLARFPYPGGALAHWGADVYQCHRLRHEGFRLVEVPTVKSVWRERVDGSWKYVHDESEG
jgi:glycosyltransferase involved in cell wall biosynthesis